MPRLQDAVGARELIFQYANEMVGTIEELTEDINFLNERVESLLLETTHLEQRLDSCHRIMRGLGHQSD